MNHTFTRLDAVRLIRDPSNLFFTVALPVFFYLIFGAATPAKTESIGEANVGLYVMVTMGAYGVVGATAALGALVALERRAGWTQQLALTPMRPRSYIATKVVVAVALAAVPLTVVYTVGAATGARGSALSWLVGAAFSLLAAGLFTCYGLIFGFAIKGDAAVAIASGSTVVWAFLANAFIPLSGLLLDIGRFTPLYGVISLARRTATQGLVYTSGAPIAEPLWIPVANLVVWTLLLSLLATLAVRGAKTR